MPRTETRPQANGALCEDKAWIFGFLAGDGHVSERWGAGYNTDAQLAGYLAQALLRVYGIEPTCSLRRRANPRKNLWIIRFNAEVAKDLNSYCLWATMDWRVPGAVFDGSDKIRAAWLRGFYDAEGTAHLPTPAGSKAKQRKAWSVSVSSANEAGIGDVSALLDSLGIDHKRYQHQRKRKPERVSYIVSVHKRSEVIKFDALVSFCADVKREKLAGVREASFGKDSKWAELLPKIHALLRSGKKQYEIDKELGLYERESTAALAWERRKLGIKKRRDSLGPLAEQVAGLKEGDGNLTCQEIADKLQVPAHRIKAASQWSLRRDGVPKREGGSIYRSRMQAIEDAGLKDAPAPEVSQSLGITEKQVLDARKWTAEQDGTRKKRVNLNDYATELRDRLTRGDMQREIAKDLGCSQAAVAGWKKRNMTAEATTGGSPSAG